MEISRTIQTTIGMLILTLLLLVGGAYLLITQGQDLERLRDELAAAERRKGEVERSLQAISMQLVDIRSKMNQARAGTIYLVDAMEASQDFLDDQGTRVRSLCEQTSGGENADPSRSTRSEGDGLNLGSHSDDADFISFCRAFSEGADWRRASNAVAIRRATAARPDEHDAVAAEYQRLLPNARSSPQEAARMHEGLAYSRLRQGRIEDAVSAIGLARRTAPDLALPALTSLKIDCERGAESGQIVAGVQALRARLDAKIVRIDRILRRGPNPPMARALHYARVERRMVEQDPELYEVCAYAGLAPQT